MKKFILLFLLLGFFYACEEDKENDPAPTLPPVMSMVMDYSDFQSNKDANLTAFNWGYSALNVAFWNAILTVNLAIPVAAFVNCFNYEATYDSDLNGWVWKYDFQAGGATHQAELEATLSESLVQWEMYITIAGASDRFLWFSGSSDLGATNGIWELNYNIEDPTNYLDIEWNYNHTDSTGDIRYTVVETDNEQFGSYIEYGLTDNNFDAYYEISLVKEDKLTEIEWSRTTKEGRVRDEVHFSDTDWHCWDSELQDTDCQ